MRFLFKILPEKIFNLYILLSNYTSLSFAGKVRDILDKIVKAYCGIELNKKMNVREMNVRAVAAEAK